MELNFSFHGMNAFFMSSLTIARIHSQFESLGFVGKYDQSPTNIVNSRTLKYGGADFLQNPRIFSLQNGPRMRANEIIHRFCDSVASENLLSYS
jgi:hypothetical protein